MLEELSVPIPGTMGRSAEVSLDESGCRVALTDVPATVRWQIGETYSVAIDLCGNSLTLLTETHSHDVQEDPAGEILLASHLTLLTHPDSEDRPIAGSVSVTLPEDLMGKIQTGSLHFTGIKPKTPFFIESVTLEPGKVLGSAGIPPDVYVTVGNKIRAWPVEFQWWDLWEALRSLSDSQNKVPIRLNMASTEPLTRLKPLSGDSELWRY